MKGIIVAVSPEGVIGVGNKIPWSYKGDLRRFKRITMDSSIVMGRRTWESIGRVLPGRRNVVITSGSLDVPGVETYADLASAIASCSGNVWFIGGARIYEEAMRHADLLDVTYVPDQIADPDAVRFPAIDPSVWKPGPQIAHEDEPVLRRRVFTRRG
jgi:dihydrofolate reductase